MNLMSYRLDFGAIGLTTFNDVDVVFAAAAGSVEGFFGITPSKPGGGPTTMRG